MAALLTRHQANLQTSAALPAAPPPARPIAERTRFMNPKLESRGGLYYIRGYSEVIKPTDEDADGLFKMRVFDHIDWINQEEGKLSAQVDVKFEFIQHGKYKCVGATLEVLHTERLATRDEIMAAWPDERPSLPRGTRGGRGH